jgi:hypothetical protein
MVVRQLPSPLLELAGAAVPVVGLVNSTLARRANTFLDWCRAEDPARRYDACDVGPLSTQRFYHADAC